MGETAKSGKCKDRGMWAKMRLLPSALLHFVNPIRKKADAVHDPIPVSKTSIRRLEALWKSQLEFSQAGAISQMASSEEKLILNRIKDKTRHENRNNVTRTGAYWTAYEENPELHWALLAHMVSRNGGWCMTDLRGELLPHLLNKTMTVHLFNFLERANGLIFHDAYPQLLLYAESKKQQRSLFHLLPALNVSAWMQPVWQDYWMHNESAVLTISLIINEQNFIEQRVVQNAYYQQTVLNTPLFKSQAWLQLNQVGFPFSSLLQSASNQDPSSHLAGLILENFADLSERIEFGKSLYAILFGVPEVYQGVLSFAASTSHTGSRADYWPHLYTPTGKASPDKKYQERLDGCVWKPGAAPLYSPPLAQAWPDQPLELVQPGDWFIDLRKPLQHMRAIPVPVPFDMTNEVYFGLNKIELAIRASEML
ncbi:Protein of unknown function [Paenibacillus sp. yr247]|uniref:DUF2515 family protein n=1 Tax=Paenibacillus sp. yr247 TaxID=1761880 RepID=UPI00088291C4|nr:DUF2515 family protein [Paenibacillus sp. yr247]SDO44820.1 Protein of unknown function [Paenibacillus sp. yr247]